MQEISALNYCIEVTVCTLFLLYFYITIRRYSKPGRSRGYLFACIFFLIAMAPADILYALREARIFTANAAIYEITEILYSLCSIFSGFCWFIFSELEQCGRPIRTRIMRLICMISVALMALITLTNPIHHLCFTFDPTGHYQRGRLLPLFTAYPVLLITLSGITALLRSFLKRHYPQRHVLRILFAYAFTILLTQALQQFIGSIIPFRLMGATAVLFFYTQLLLRRSISVDMISGIRNRFALEQYLSEHFYEAGESFFLAMLDIDSFKLINDRYGHTRGDQAIRLMGQALDAAIPRSFFSARYGGDEFIFIGEAEKAEIDDIVAALHTELDTLSEQHTLGFSIDFTVGVASKGDHPDTILDLLNAADQNLYARKREKLLLR